MPRFILDTDTLTLLRQGNEAIIQKLQAMDISEAVRFVGRLPILGFSQEAILRYRSLLSQKLNVGKMDLRIAAIALEHKAIVITRNTRDFERIPNLTIADWAPTE
ncbi:type II toxin-antitoxin system VapC family toxin [Armatimonas sp.]|uniref:type II toxin-antitoxin system VapC family toxin n=1 Tax=Armatimonas sp. TaxID=1872638 RepID=UPI0037502790